MPSIETNRRAGQIARENGTLVPFNATAKVDAVPPVPTYPASPNPNLRTTLPASYVQSPDQQRQWQTGAVRQQRIPPVSATGNAIVGAQASSQTIITVQSGGGGPLLETNNIKNNKQDTLNLIAGTGVTLSANSQGGVTINGAAGSGDGLIHGDTVWEYDSAYSIWRDDFLMSSGASGGTGDFNWGIGGLGTPAIYNYGGALPYIGQCELNLANTAANQNGFVVPRYATTGIALVRNVWDTAWPLFDYPGWKMTWVFTIRRPDPRNGGGFHAFDTTRLSLYVGLANGWAPNSSALTLDPRPNVFFGCRFDTDTTAPSIADTTYVLEACTNAIDNTGTTRYNNQGTLGGTFNTGIAPADGVFHRLEISCVTVGSVTITLDGVGQTFTITPLTTTWPNAAIATGNGQALMFMPTPSAAYSNTVGQSGFGPGSRITFAGGSLPAAYVGTFTALQNVSGSAVIAPAGPGGVTGTFTSTVYPGVYPVASIAQDSTGAVADQWSRSLVLDYFSLVWNKGLATGAPAPSSTLPRYW